MNRTQTRPERTNRRDSRIGTTKFTDRAGTGSSDGDVRVSGNRAWTSVQGEHARQTLDLLIDEAVLAEAAVREGAPWSPADSAAHRALRDQRVLALALDSVLAATRAATPHGAALGGDALGTLARDRAVARLEATYDDSA